MSDFFYLILFYIKKPYGIEITSGKAGEDNV